MVIIKFRNGADWYKATWVYRQLSEDVARHCDDAEVAHEMVAGGWYGALALDRLAEPLATRVQMAIVKVAKETLQGALPGWVGPDVRDDDGRRMYREAMEELLETANLQPDS